MGLPGDWPTPTDRLPGPHARRPTLAQQPLEAGLGLRAQLGLARRDPERGGAAPVIHSQPWGMAPSRYAPVAAQLLRPPLFVGECPRPGRIVEERERRVSVTAAVSSGVAGRALIPASDLDCLDLEELLEAEAPQLAPWPDCL